MKLTNLQKDLTVGSLLGLATHSSVVGFYARVCMSYARLSL